MPLQLDTISEALMLPGVRSLRSVLHSTAIEVLLALTPRHLQSMMDSLIDFLNAQYAKFMARHPTFKVRFWPHPLLQNCFRAGMQTPGHGSCGCLRAEQACMPTCCRAASLCLHIQHVVHVASNKQASVVERASARSQEAAWLLCVRLGVQQSSCNKHDNPMQAWLSTTTAQ